MKLLKKIVWLLFLALLLLSIPRLSGTIASLFNYNAIDPDGAYAWISVHHIVQALIFIGIIIGIKKFKPISFGFGWGDRKVGIKYVLRFTLIFGLGSLASHVLTILTNSFQPFAYPLTATNIIGQMGFQLLLSGPSEELIFRAFAITMLTLLFKNRIINAKISNANIIAAVIFGLAHVGFSFAPFEIRYSLFQVILAIVLGIFYGDCYEKTKSIYYPMMMHSISNIIMVGFSIIASTLLRLNG
ncbi:MAG: type II CAAX endopeptidase family protein [Clostridia bacterium]